MHPLQVVNRCVQWASLLFLGEWALYGIFRCPFVVPFISCQNCPVLTCPGRISQMFWGVWGGWLALLLLLGRSFCGWVCPAGTVQRWLSKSPCAGTDIAQARLYAWGKYLAVAACLYVYFVMAQPRVAVPIRVGEFLPSMALTLGHAFPLWLARTGIFVTLVLACIFVAMAWCRFACPMGGVLEAVRPFSLFRVFKTDTCNDCDACRRACYMKTRPQEANCTNCGDCLHACPQKCIGMGIKAR